MGEETEKLIENLQEYDNEEGYRLDYKDVKERLEPVVNKIIEKGGDIVDDLHQLLNDESTWSSLFALEALKKIKDEKSISYLIGYIVRTEKGEYGDSGEEAMLGLINIGGGAIEPLLKEIKRQFEIKQFYFYLTGALTGIKNEKVYRFMKEITEDYIKNEDKYDEWFTIDAFVSDFRKQGKKEIIPLLKELLTLERTSKSERIEIESLIEELEDPIGYEQRLEREIEEAGPLIEEFFGQNEKKMPKIDQKRVEEDMWTPEKDLKMQFKCQNCNKKQNIDPGLIKIMGDQGLNFVFENEILCQFCQSNDIGPSEQGEREIMFQSIGVFMGSRKGVVAASDDVYVENKRMPFEKTYDYIKRRIEQSPENGKLYLRAGNVARNFNRYHEAIKHYEKAIELDNRLIAVYFNLVEIYAFRYKYYGIEKARDPAIFYLNKMVDLLNSRDFNSATIRNENIIIKFICDISCYLGVDAETRIKNPFSKKMKIGRNDPCPCGSGKKYKKCCLED